MSYFGVSTRNGVGLGLGTVPSLTNTPLGYRLAPSLDLSFAGSDTLSPAITFSRTTNATLTNSAGLVANAPMNLLTFSEQFDNAAWTKTRATVTANAIAAPDGNLTADKLVENTDTNSHFINQNATVSSGIAITYSIYAKKGERNYLSIFCLGTTAASNTFFDLSTGVVVSTSANATSSIQNIGNGWYRCTVTATTNATTTGIYPGISVDGVNASYTGNGTSGIFIWGAQVEIGSTATTYNPTTVKNLLGFTENFDNAAWTKSNAFVQTNLLLQSEAFDNAYWGKSNVSVTADSIAAPNGSITADTLSDGVAAGLHYTESTAQTLTGVYTASVYAKKGSSNFVGLYAQGVSQGVFFNLNTGAFSANIVGAPTAYTITDAGNGWYRCTITFTTSATSLSVRLFTSTDGSTFNYTGNNNTVYIWGAQLVQGTSAGDYKATYAAAAAVGYTDIYGQPFAQKLVETTANTQHYTSQSQALAWPTGSKVVGVVYCKAAERRYARVLIGGSTTGWNAYCAFDLQTGTAGSPSANSATATASITDIGGGWYRCAVLASPTVSSTTSALLQVNINNSLNPNDDSYTGDGTSGIYIFGAQLSDSASVDPYVYNPVAAPSSVAYYGPRFDYDPVTLAPKGLLIEEQRTNLLTYSEQFDNAAWTKVLSTSVTPNSAISPDGTANADLLTFTSQFGCIQQSATLTSGTQYTISFWAKVNSGSNTYSVYNNTSGASLGTVTPTGAWVRYAFTFTAAATGVAVFNLIQDRNASGFGSVFIYGAQLEAGAFATSYIPTVASQVTRAADSASMIGNNFARWYNQAAGTALVNATATVAFTFTMCGAGNSGNDALYNYAPSTYTTQAFTGGVLQANINNGVASGSAAKIAVAYAFNDFATSANAGTIATDATYTQSIMDKLRLGTAANNTTSGVVYIKSFSYYNRRLSNTELQGITS